MGLPRHVQMGAEQYFNPTRKGAQWHISSHVVGAVVRFGINRYAELIARTNTKNPEHVCRCLIRWQMRLTGKVAPIGEVPCERNVKDELSKVQSQLYVGLDTAGKAIYREVSVSHRFVPSLQARNNRRMEQDLEELKLRAEILSVRGRVYQSRTFPATLKRIIFERDGYCCRSCGKHRDQLIAERSHLEVDHMKAWIDGGQTCYENGETLCRACNIAKHHSKAYWRKMSALSSCD